MADTKGGRVVDAEHCIDFDELLVYMGDFGFYQKRLIVYMIPFVLAWTIVYVPHIFLITLPDHWCYVPELSHLPTDDQLHLAIPKNSNDNFEKCVMYDANYTYLLEAKVTEANKSWPQKPCQDWVYDKELLPYETIATEYNWVCSKNMLGTWTVGINFLGCITGGIIFGYLSDHLGRIPAVLISNICGFIGGTLSAFCKSFLWFSVTRFFVGMAYDYCYTPFLILVLECVSPKHRSFVTNFSIAMYFTPTAAFLPWVALWCNNWRVYAVVASMPILIAILMLIIVPESPRWLISVGKIDKALKTIKGIAKTNGKTIPEDVMDYFQKCSVFQYNQELKSKSYTVIDLFKSWQSFRLISLFCIVWMITSISYDAHVRVIIEIGPDIFYTFSLACIVELPAGLIPLFILNKTGRKILTLVGFIGCILGSLVATLLNVKWQMAIAASMARLFSSMNYNIGLQWAAESLPTVVRGQGVAFIHVMGFSALFISPFIVYTETIWIKFPMIIICILGILAAILLSFLPETNGYPLPQTMEEAKDLWKQKRGFSWARRKYIQQ